MSLYYFWGKNDAVYSLALCREKEESFNSFFSKFTQRKIFLIFLVHLQSLSKIPRKVNWKKTFWVKREMKIAKRLNKRQEKYEFTEQPATGKGVCRVTFGSLWNRQLRIPQLVWTSLGTWYFLNPETEILDTLGFVDLTLMYIHIHYVYIYIWMYEVREVLWDDKSLPLTAGNWSTTGQGVRYKLKPREYTSPGKSYCVHELSVEVSNSHSSE